MRWWSQKHLIHSVSTLVVIDMYFDVVVSVSVILPRLALVVHVLLLSVPLESLQIRCLLFFRCTWWIRCLSTFLYIGVIGLSHHLYAWWFMLMTVLCDSSFCPPVLGCLPQWVGGCWGKNYPVPKSKNVCRYVWVCPVCMVTVHIFAHGSTHPGMLVRYTGYTTNWPLLYIEMTLLMQKIKSGVHLFHHSTIHSLAYNRHSVGIEYRLVP